MKATAFIHFVTLALFLALPIGVVANSNATLCGTKEGPAHWNGECRDGVAQGKGVARYDDNYIASIDGKMIDGIPNGEVTIRYSDGGYYQGTVVDGEFDGFGTLMKPWGEGYSGNWSEGRRDGEGEYISADGRRIAGVWLRDRLLGSWYADPKSQCKIWWRVEDDPVGEASWSGDCVNGKAHGAGRIAWKSGDQDLPVIRSIDFTGLLNKGVIQGKGEWSQWEKYVNVTNTRDYFGEWVDGQRSGVGIEKAETNSNEFHASIFVQERYEESWKQDLYWGAGKYKKTHQGGGEHNLTKTEEGEYAAGRLHGMGHRKAVRISTDGGVRTESESGFFVNGDLGGEGVKISEVDADGGQYYERVEGNWGGEPNLIGVAKYNDGSVFEGSFAGFAPSPSRGYCTIPNKNFSGACETLGRDTSSYSGEVCLVPLGKQDPCLKVISSWVF